MRIERVVVPARRHQRRLKQDGPAVPGTRLRSASGSRRRRRGRRCLGRDSSVSLASGPSTAPTSKQERAWVDLAPACRQEQGAGAAGIQGNPRGHDNALPAPAYAQMGAPESQSGAHLLRTTRQRLTQHPPDACPLRRAGMSVEPCSSTVCGRRACRSSRGPCGDAGNNPCRRQADEVVAPSSDDA